ncbi:hypothetical protein SAMN04487926_107273 [Paraburkholderia steynii]|uniref:Secreted protein n=1 Tax=Paraburkholderia steynii TaxID=1245441 RepID=A0A7Z7FIR0_9BURK|nr:hypothetical protein SAMN04487926_107273 [Paraburkholderia steynii]
MLAVLAAFFCLLFFAAAKKSRCRPAQGRRVKHANEARMPAKRLEQPNRPRREGKNAGTNAKAKSQTTHKRRYANTSASSKKPSLQIQLPFRITRTLSNNNIKRNIMHFPLQSANPAHLIRDTDCHRHLPSLAKRGKRTVVISTPIPKPIPIDIKPNTRHKQQIRRNHFAGSRFMNPMSPDLHRHIRRPDMKFQWPITPGNHRQTRAPRAIASEPRGNHSPNVELP